MVFVVEHWTTNEVTLPTFTCSQRRLDTRHNVLRRSVCARRKNEKLADKSSYPS